MYVLAINSVSSDKMLQKSLAVHNYFPKATFEDSGKLVSERNTAISRKQDVEYIQALTHIYTIRNWKYMYQR